MAGLTADKRVVRNDIKLAAKIITNLDGKWGLWKPEGGEKEGKKPTAHIHDGLILESNCLSTVTLYLSMVDEL